jgi:hypothetical protein
MKKIINLILIWSYLATAAFAQFAEPAITGANFVPNTISLGETSTLTFSFSNAGPTPIPANSIRVKISTADNYYTTDGTTVPGNLGGAIFSWVYTAATDTWTGTNINDVPAFDGGNVTLQVTGNNESPSLEITNISIQIIDAFIFFTNNSGNDNLQSGLTVTLVVADTDGDGDPDNTDPAPNDSCIYGAGQVYADATPAFLANDCDGDGVTNGNEIDPDGDGTPGGTGLNGPATDPQDACSLNLGDVSLTATSTGDCDGDGVTNADEINSTGGADPQTDPNDLCDYNPAEQGTPDAAWMAADCDMDGDPNGTDPNPSTPTAVDDNGTAPFGSTTSIDILGNDDFLANDGNTIVEVAGGTAGGTIVFDPITGELDYTPIAGESGTDVTVIYEVCQGAVCAQATVTLSITSTTVACNIDVALWLEGSYESTLTEMRTDLNDQQLLPGQDPMSFLGQETPTPVGQPYSDPPWNYNGTEGDAYNYITVGNGKANYDADAVDWVLVSLRTSTLAISTFCTQAAWLMKDGTVTFPAGCNCTLTAGQEIYIVIEHRNHLPIMTPNTVSVTNAGVSFDFRSQQSYVNFTGNGQKGLAVGVFGMFTANGDQSSAPGAQNDINANDESIWTSNNSNGDTYNLGDFNMTGDINANDESFWLENTGKSSDVDN